MDYDELIYNLTPELQLIDLLDQLTLRNSVVSPYLLEQCSKSAKTDEELPHSDPIPPVSAPDIPLP
jgi:hypothetical protein